MIQLDYKRQGTNLVITADEAAKKELAELKEEKGEAFGCDDVMGDVFENMIANSELDWVRPEDTGDLTDAPMLGIVGNEGEQVEKFYGRNFNDQPILERWAFMGYQIDSPQDCLLRNGFVVFQSE